MSTDEHVYSQVMDDSTMTSAEGYEMVENRQQKVTMN